MTTKIAECGTPSGARRHRRLGEPVCDDCREASAAYMRDFRKRRPDFYADEQRRNSARTRALYRLAKAHPDEFRHLYVEELA